MSVPLPQDLLAEGLPAAVSGSSQLAARWPLLHPKAAALPAQDSTLCVLMYCCVGCWLGCCMLLQVWRQQIWCVGCQHEMAL